MFIRKYYTSIYSHIHDEKIILMTGARQVGKTTLMKQIWASLEKEGYPVYQFSLEDPEILALLNGHPRELFSLVGEHTKKVYVCLDEIQYLRDPSWFLKYHADLSQDRVKIIATGSSAFYIDTRFHDSLAGRKWLYEILPLDFIEWLEITGLSEYIQDLAQVSTNPTYYRSGEVIRLYEQYLLYGGYPWVAMLRDKDSKQELLRLLVTDYAKKDAIEWGLEKPEKYFLLMKLLAHSIGNLMNKNEISTTLGIDIRTLDRYLFILSRSYHIDFLRPFHRNIRSELTKMPKIYFYDTGIRNILVNSFESMMLRPDNGALLENLVLSSLHHAYRHEDIHFWRTTWGDEVDIVLPALHRAYEVKMNIEKYIPKKYTSFTEAYPDIILEGIDMRKSLALWNKNMKK